MKIMQHTVLFRRFLYGFFALLFLNACTQPAENPKVIAEQYWHNLQTGNTKAAEKLATENSQHSTAEHSKRIADITKLENGETKTVVSTTITTSNPDTNHTHTQTFDTVLVLQQGRWKVDVDASPIPASPSAQKEKLQKLAKELSESMQKNIESIDEAVSHGMDALNETLRESSKEMGESLLDMMKQLNESMHESIDKMKKQKQLDPTEGEGIL